MTTQAEKDWEEYNHGLQGTMTGSAYNEQGLRDRYVPPASSYTTAKPSAGKAQSRTAKAKVKSPNADNSDDFSVLFATVAFFAVAIYLYEPSDESFVLPLIVGGIAAVLAGKLYKVILGLTVVVLVMFVLYATNQ